ncbi:pyridoxal phosphate-dependent aminotransferase [Tunicatimonas pelagia]|uniref:pyridoxal phosphate-dependent aminotransferase n=1 Tax=Tunicatimonas pelagia TaxID=931531 RepID=UPI002664EF21|nr:aminotransferase class I/II-fold pyridoxal phosphate-dependent enzyme [Tunicatimonas pelagia]WKN43797.1 aminotransferase class I/II-fold pyridoxal phosphate-dependent enzyme [Tunicatimonas pelagia]
MIISPARRLQQVEEYYFSRKLQQIRQMNEAGQDVINLGIGSPDLPPSSTTIETLSEAAQKSDAHGYQPYRGVAALRQAIAAWSKRTFSIELNAEQEVLPLMGSKEGITHISMAFLNPGDEVLVPSLGYPAYTAVTHMVEARVQTYPLQDETWQPDFTALESLDTGRTKLLWCNYPHMPTGAPAQYEVFEKLVAFAQARNILICHDNPYALVLNKNQPLSILSVPGAKEVAIELHSLSKSHNMAGWRIGWIAGRADYLNEIIKVKSNVDSGMFKAVQQSAVVALQNSPTWHQQRNQEYQERQQITFKLADTLNCKFDAQQQGMFVWAQIPTNEESAEALSERILQQHQVFITPGHIFGNQGNRYLRFSLCVSQERLLQAVHRIVSSV